jgi:HrpA-like RNA helicase
MPDASLPEICRVGLAGAVLHLKALAVPVDVLAFDFLDAPSRCAGLRVCVWPVSCLAS